MRSKRSSSQFLISDLLVATHKNQVAPFLTGHLLSAMGLDFCLRRRRSTPTSRSASTSNLSLANDLRRANRDVGSNLVWLTLNLTS